MAFVPKILVVDDDALMSELLATGLERVGGSPRTVNSSREAAEIINNEKFDGIFLDWIMPEMDGLELARAVRSSKSNSLCPMVMVTGNTDPDAMRHCFRAGISFFFRKPVTLLQVQKLAKCMWDLMLREHLRYQRVPLQVPVLCTYEEQSRIAYSKGHTINVSTTGVRIDLGARLEPGTVIQLEFTVPGDPLPFRPEAVVVRQASSQHLGVRLINLDYQQRWRLIEYSRHTLGESLGPEA